MARTPQISIVDEDCAVRDSLITLISLSDCDATGHATGSDCLAAVDAGIDCVISAAQLPDMTGLDLFRALKARHPSLRFALLLSRSNPTALAQARSAGVDAVFRKPLVSRSLREFVEQSGGPTTDKERR